MNTLLFLVHQRKGQEARTGGFKNEKENRERITGRNHGNGNVSRMWKFQGK